MATIQPASTVAGQVESLLGKDSGLQQQARASGQKQVARRGLLNSSLAAEASQKATYDAVTPIAQQDAQTNATFDLNDKQFDQSRTLAKDNFGYNTSLSAQGSTQDRALAGDQFGYSSNLSAQDATQQLKAQTQAEGSRASLSNQEFGQTTQLNTQQNAAAREAQLTAIQAQSGLSRQEAEQQLVSQEKAAGYNSSLSAQEAKQGLLTQAQAAEQRAALSTQEYGQTGYLNAQQNEAARQQQIAQIQAQYGLSAQEAAQNLNEIDARAKNEMQLQQFSATTQKELAGINQQGSMALAKLDSDNRLLLQTSTSAASRYSDLLQQTSAIMQNSALSTADKITATNSLIAYSQQAFALQNELLTAAGLTPSTALPEFIGTTPTGAIANPGAAPANPPISTPAPVRVPPRTVAPTPSYLGVRRTAN